MLTNTVPSRPHNRLLAFTLGIFSTHKLIPGLALNEGAVRLFSVTVRTGLPLPLLPAPSRLEQMAADSGKGSRGNTVVFAGRAVAALQL